MLALCASVAVVDPVSAPAPRRRFDVNIGGTDVPVTATDDVDPGHFAEALKSPLFRRWVSEMADNVTAVVRGVKIRSIDMFGPRVGFINLKADVVDHAGDFVPGVAFLRGDAVAVLYIVRCGDMSFVVTVTQQRVPMGRRKREIPAGMLDGDDNFVGVAAKEIKEETGLEANDLIDMSAAVGHVGGSEMSAGGCDERIRFMFQRHDVSAEQLAEMRRKFDTSVMGAAHEGEKIHVGLVPLEHAHTISDAKAVCALGLARHLRLI
jgi:ADP-sugar diphosphatase